MNTAKVKIVARRKGQVIDRTRLGSTRKVAALREKKLGREMKIGITPATV